MAPTIYAAPSPLEPYFSGTAGTVVGVLAAVAIVLIVLTVFKSIFGLGRTGRLRRRAEELQESVAEYKERLAKVEPHVMDYFNSISAEGAQAFNLAKKIIQAVDARLEEIAQALARGNSKAISRGLRITDADLNLTTSSVHLLTMSDEEIPVLQHHDVGPKLEELFHIVGRELAVASRKDKDFRAKTKMPKRKRRATMHNLREAGFIDSAEIGSGEEEQDVESGDKKEKPAP